MSRSRNTRRELKKLLVTNNSQDKIDTKILNHARRQASKKACVTEDYEPHEYEFLSDYNRDKKYISKWIHRKLA